MGPFIKDKNDGTKMMIHSLIALIPITIFSFIKRGNTGLHTIILILISSVSIFLFEAIINIIKEKNIKNIFKDNYGLLNGLILALILPSNTPILLVIIGTLVAKIITKILYLIFKKNIINSVVISYLIIFILIKFISPEIIVNNNLLNNNILNDIGTYETLVKPYGRILKIFIGNIPEIIGSMSAALSILALAYLMITKVIKWRIPIIYIITIFAITYVIGGINDLGIWYPLFQIFTGGLIFKSIFIASEQQTSPVTPIGQILYAIFLGILTIIFRYLTPIPEGILISILIMNMLVPILDRIGTLARFDFKKTIIPFLIAWILIIGLSIGISVKYDNNENTIQNIENKK